MRRWRSLQASRAARRAALVTAAVASTETWAGLVWAPWPARARGCCIPGERLPCGPVARRAMVSAGSLLPGSPYRCEVARWSLTPWLVGLPGSAVLANALVGRCGTCPARAGRGWRCPSSSVSTSRNAPQLRGVTAAGNIHAISAGDRSADSALLAQGESPALDQPLRGWQSSPAPVPPRSLCGVALKPCLWPAWPAVKKREQRARTADLGPKTPRRPTRNFESAFWPASGRPDLNRRPLDPQSCSVRRWTSPGVAQWGLDQAWQSPGVAGCRLMSACVGS